MARKSSLRKLNARIIASDVRKQLKENQEFKIEQFLQLLEPHLAKYEDSDVAKKNNEVALKEIFKLFDENDNGTVDSAEMANILAILCGGTLQDKINAAFILFDSNSSGTMSFNELTLLMQSVFKLVDRCIHDDHRGHDHTKEMLSQIDFDRLPIVTA